MARSLESRLCRDCASRRVVRLPKATLRSSCRTGGAAAPRPTTHLPPVRGAACDRTETWKDLWELGTTATILRVVAQPQAVDHEVFESVLVAERARLAIDFTLEWTENLDRNVNQGDGGRATAALLVTAPGTPDLAWLSSEHAAAPVVRLDLALNEPDRSAGLARHIHGRGIDGLRWAVRAAHYRALWPGVHVPYGTHLEQFGELRLPVSRSTTADDDGSAVAEHRWPLVILLHGGFWRSRWGLDPTGRHRHRPGRARSGELECGIPATRSSRMVDNSCRCCRGPGSGARAGFPISDR